MPQIQNATAQIMTKRVDTENGVWGVAVVKQHSAEHTRVPDRAGVLKTSNSGELADALVVTAAAVCGCGRRRAPS
jgi:hypothetical protein